MLGDMTPKVVPGFGCDGQVLTDAYARLLIRPERCEERITLDRFYQHPQRQGWTLTRDGLAFCKTCTPRFNPAHKCPPPPPPAPPVTESFTFTVRNGEIEVEPFDWNDV